MTAVVFLAIAVVISVIGGLLVWFRHREPTTWDSGIRDFAREMDALRPGEDQLPAHRVVGPPGSDLLAEGTASEGTALEGTALEERVDEGRDEQQLEDR